MADQTYTVKEIKSGCLKDANKTLQFNNQLQVGDRLSGIKNYKSFAQILEDAHRDAELQDELDKIKDGEKIKLVFIRNAPGEKGPASLTDVAIGKKKNKKK